VIVFILVVVLLCICFYGKFCDNFISEDIKIVSDIPESPKQQQQRETCNPPRRRQNQIEYISHQDQCRIQLEQSQQQLPNNRINRMIEARSNPGHSKNTYQVCEWCPNKSNKYHQCSKFCQKRWTPKQNLGLKTGKNVTRIQLEQDQQHRSSNNQNESSINNAISNPVNSGESLNTPHQSGQNQLVPVGYLQPGNQNLNTNDISLSASNAPIVKIESHMQLLSEISPLPAVQLSDQRNQNGTWLNGRWIEHDISEITVPTTRTPISSENGDASEPPPSYFEVISGNPVS